MAGIILFFGLIVFIIIAFSMKYINPSLRLFRLTIYTYLGVALVTILVSLSLLYPKVSGLEVKTERKPMKPLYEYVGIESLSDDYLVDTYELDAPAEKVDIRIENNFDMWAVSPEFYVEKEAGREHITIHQYASSYMSDGIEVYRDKSKLVLEKDKIIYQPEKPKQIKKSFNRIFHDNITAQFYGTQDTFENNSASYYADAAIYFHIIIPENVDITHEEDIFYIEYLDEEE